MSFALFLSLYALLLGLIVGSYLNVVIYRLPRGISTVLPRSRCPVCGVPVAARDNIPVVSFLLLRGRCRHCRSPISWRYPAIEALNGCLFVLCLWRFGPSWDAGVGAVLCALLIVLAAIDLEHYLLPDALTLSGIGIGLAGSFVVDWTTPRSSALGALVGGGVLLALIGIWYLVRGELGMGFGDVKMLAMLGAFLGARGMIVALFAASVLGAVTGIAMMSAGRLGMKSKLPFGVFLALGGVLSLFLGEPLLALYAQFL